MLEVIVARHGQSQANHRNIIQGQTSTPLSELGLRQARALGGALAGLTFAAVYSSDLERAMQTAQLAAPDCTPIPTVELREWHLGVFQGLTYDEVKEKYPQEWQAFRDLRSDFRVPGGESDQDIYQRAKSFLAYLVEKHTSGRVLLVSHGGLIRKLLKIALDIQAPWPVSPSITNASYSQFTFLEGHWRLDSWNCTAHLKGLLENTGVF